MSAPRDDDEKDPYNPADLCPRWKDPDHDSPDCPACNGLEPDWLHDEEEPSAPTLRNPEQHEIAGAFADMLAVATGEGGRRRAAGTKRHWKVDPNHLAAAGRHWTKYHDGERYDEEGVHHLVKVAWRCLAWAYPELVEDGLIPEDPR